MNFPERPHDPEPTQTACPGFTKRYFRVDRKHIAYLRFILESYDGLAFLRTLDSRTGLIEIASPPQRQADAWALVNALCHETGMQDVATPSQVPGL